MSSTCFQGSGTSPSGFPEQGVSERSVSAKSTPPATPCCNGASQGCKSNTTFPNFRVKTCQCASTSCVGCSDSVVGGAQMSKRIPSGTLFGSLTVIEDLGGYHCVVLVRCVCGKDKKVQRSSLLAGNTRSCGCLSAYYARETLRQRGGLLSAHPLYKVWTSMLRRCRSERDKAYPAYGGRGISVDERWDDFRAFVHDVGTPPGKGYSLDRVDNNGNYAPGNVRWATSAEQARNRRTNTRVSHGGLSLCLSEWAERTGVKASTLKTRLRRGLRPETGLFSPARRVEGLQ